MALEQIQAYNEGRSLEELGPTTTIGPDRFALLDSSELKETHELLSQLIIALDTKTEDLPTKPEIIKKALESSDEERTKMFIAIIERTFWRELCIAFDSTDKTPADYFFCDAWSRTYLLKLMNNGVNVPEIALAMFQFMAFHRYRYEITTSIDQVYDLLFEGLKDQPFREEWKAPLIRLRTNILDTKYSLWPSLQKTFERIDILLGNGMWQSVFPGEVWSDQVIDDLQSKNTAEQTYWIDILNHCNEARSAKPSSKWNTSATKLLKALGKDKFTENVVKWLVLFDKGRSVGWQSPEGKYHIHEVNADILRGLVWFSALVGELELSRVLTKLCIASYRKIPGIGPRSARIANAVLYALGEIGTEDAVGQLAILKVRVKMPSAQKGIEKALNSAAERIGMSRADLEEVSVPAYGLNEKGILEEEFDDYKAKLNVENSKVILTWFDDKGKVLKSPPASLKTTHSEELKEFKTAASDIERMIAAQAFRIESKYLEQKKWDFPRWKEHYLDHPLVGTVVKRLIWQLEFENAIATGIFQNGNFVSHDGTNLDSKFFSDRTLVSLWHPIFATTEEVVAWREYLFEHQIRQPFKQAHREIYVLTDAERNTDTYSNRYAAHVLKQHQYNALCQARGWKNQLRLMVDADFPPSHIDVPSFDLQAQFWVEGIGENYEEDVNETGTFHYITTDQVKFYSISTERELHLNQIPALAFTEIMRDVDLFVGVASIGNDPNWMDRGAEGPARYGQYWTDYSFGELNVTAQFRKAVLEMLIPKLKIADRCSFNDKFLLVRGDIRTYKIHLGSGNILMMPDDKYLCIVANQSVNKKGENVFLPFEGDQRLSLILSKAILLADDKKISDPTITRQIGK